MVHGKPCINGFRNGPKPEFSRRSSRIWQQMRICRILVLTAAVILYALEVMNYDCSYCSRTRCITGEKK